MLSLFAFRLLFPAREGAGETITLLSQEESHEPNTARTLHGCGQGDADRQPGHGLALDLGLGTLQADEAPDRLNFGKLEPLVDLLQSTPANKLQPLLVEKLRSGMALRKLVAGAALANARTFGGEDYIGFHTLMALTPSFQMASEMPEDRRACRF